MFLKYPSRINFKVIWGLKLHYRPLRGGCVAKLTFIRLEYPLILKPGWRDKDHRAVTTTMSENIYPVLKSSRIKKLFIQRPEAKAIFEGRLKKDEPELALINNAILNDIPLEQCFDLVSAFWDRNNLTGFSPDLLADMVVEQYKYTRKVKEPHQRLRAGKKMVEKANKNVFKVLWYMKDVEITTPAEIQAATGLSRDQVNFQLKHLHSKGKITKSGHGKWNLTTKQRSAVLDDFAKMRASKKYRSQVFPNIEHARKGIFTHYFGADAKRMYLLWEELRKVGPEKFLKLHTNFYAVVTETEYCEEMGLEPFSS